MVSIIVAAYNSEKYLPACADSVISQSESDWELLLVDDGSTDRTGKICEEYSSKDTRIRTIHRQNGGLSAARNTGIEAARGDYLTFLDADDVFAPTFLETTLRAIDETGAEIAAVTHIKFEVQEPEWGRLRGSRNIKEMTPGEAIAVALYQRGSGLWGKRLDSSAWGKLYKRSLWEGVRFREGQWYEDLDVFYRLWEKASKIVFTGAALIGYRQHGESFLHTVTMRRGDVLDVTDRMVRHYEEEGDKAELLRAARTRRFAAHWNIYMLLKRHKIVNSEIENRCLRIITGSKREVLFNGEARLKDRLGGLMGYFLGRKRGERD